MAMGRRLRVGALAASVASAGVAAGGQPPDPPRPEILRAVAALPAHIAGAFQDLTECQQTADGQYLVFDRRAHSVYTVTPGLDAAKKLIEIGTEPGRVLDPTAFDLAPDGTFVVADAPHGHGRIQMFTASGSSLGGFQLPGRPASRIIFRSLVLNGLGALDYTGRAILVNQPELGALITEYGLDGRPIRSFGALRATGFEADQTVHLALNTGIPVADPAGGFYFVFLAGIPQFRKYTAGGALVFDRYIQGPELDRFVQSLPTTWKRQKTEDGVIPLVLPSIYAAGVAGTGELWISLPAGVTYVYDAWGEKRRVVEFRAAGPLSPTAMAFTRDARVLVAPGCYVFSAAAPSA
jgi:hypothetical protein